MLEIVNKFLSIFSRPKVVSNRCTASCDYQINYMAEDVYISICRHCGFIIGIYKRKKDGRLVKMSIWNPIGQELVGKKITRLFISNYDQSELLFETDPGHYIRFLAEGDCCSESWFYHVLGVDNLINQKIVKVEEIDMGDATDGVSRQEHDTIYGVKIITERGYCDIEFRNSSNGYYGGWLSEGCFYFGELGTDYDQITDDWTCFIQTEYMNR